jgi:DNA-binding transcriptional LysR family regulator
MLDLTRLRVLDAVARHGSVTAAAIIPGLALRAHRVKGIFASELPGSRRHVYAATYGEPPDPPATAALLAALAEAAAV